MLSHEASFGSRILASSSWGWFWWSFLCPDCRFFFWFVFPFFFFFNISLFLMFFFMFLFSLVGTVFRSFKGDHHHWPDGHGAIVSNFWSNYLCLSKKTVRLQEFMASLSFLKLQNWSTSWRKNAVQHFLIHLKLAGSGHGKLVLRAAISEDLRGQVEVPVAAASRIRVQLM